VPFGRSPRSGKHQAALSTELRSIPVCGDDDDDIEAAVGLHRGVHIFNVGPMHDLHLFLSYRRGPGKAIGEKVEKPQD